MFHPRFNLSGANHGIRIIDLPARKMATSRGHSLDEFDRWWSALDKQRTDKFHPRDFMFDDSEAKELVWPLSVAECHHNHGHSFGHSGWIF